MSSRLEPIRAPDGMVLVECGKGHLLFVDTATASPWCVVCDREMEEAALAEEEGETTV